jgi:hypothetical protein
MESKDEREVLNIKGMTLRIGSHWLPAVNAIRETYTEEEIAELTQGEVFEVLNEYTAKLEQREP